MGGERTLRAGVIGAGGIVQEGHIPALLEAGVELAAVCDSNLERAREVADRFGATHAFETFEPLLALPEIDFVTIGLPNALHAPATVAALRAGKHVLCEKPMALRAVEAQEMIDAARANDRLLSINQHMRFAESTLAMREAVLSGSLGEIYLAEARLTRQNGIPGYGSWFTNRELAGHGALVDLGVHLLDLVLFVLDFPEVVSVKGWLGGRLGEQGIGLGGWGIDQRPGGRFDVDDTAVATLTFAGGGQARIHASWALFGRPEQRFTLYGTRGGVDRTHGPDGGSELERYGEDGDGRIVQLPSAAAGDGGWSRGISSFVEAVRGHGQLLVLPEQALVTTMLLERIAESAAAGRELSVVTA